MQDYSPVVVRNLLVYLPDINELKFRMVYDLTEDAFTAAPKDDFYNEEYHTLFSRAPRTTRIPKNTNSRSELLCCMTADLDRALSKIPSDEKTRLLLIAYVEYKEVTPEEQSSLYLDPVFQRVCDLLNGG